MRLVSFRPLVRRPETVRRISPWRAIFAAVTVLPLFAPPAPAGAADPAPPPAAPATRPGEASLEFYFAALAAAGDDAAAARARGRIEARWNRSGSDTADLLAARAATAVAGGEPGLALDLIDAAIVVAPRWPTARMNRAMIHLARHDVDRALADLAATLVLEPRHIGAMGALAAMAEAAGRKAEALKWLRGLARLDPRNPAVAADRMEKLTIEVEGREL